MKTDDFDYDLPQERIAQAPCEPRDACKLLVLNRQTGVIEHRHFYDIGDYLEPGDLLVANKTKVLPARLMGTKIPTGAQVEVLLLSKEEQIDSHGLVWKCLVRPAKRLKSGACIAFGELDDPVLLAEIEDEVADIKGGRIVRFTSQQGLSLQQAIEKVGRLPLPPYIKNYQGDDANYQTVYAMEEQHSAAAPTAGLHFTPELLKRLQEQGVRIEFVELEVGLDTFRLVDEENAEDHKMHTERYHVSQEVVDAIHETKAQGKRVVAVGTTSVRSLESAFDEQAPAPQPALQTVGFSRAQTGDIVARNSATTQLYLLPGSTFHVVDALITNFHVPRSTLMMLVSAFADREKILEAYKEAIDCEYRMLSFGDAMLIL